MNYMDYWTDKFAYAEQDNSFFDNVKHAKKKSHVKKKSVNKKDVAISNMEILESGKIQVGRGKFDIGKLVESNFDDIIISRLDAIVSKESAGNPNGNPDVTNNLISELHIAEMTWQLRDKFPRTIVIPIKKSEALTGFNYLETSLLGDVLRTSTLAYVYRKIKKDWVALNKDDESGFTNVMYVPDILVFLKPKNGKAVNHPYRINVLILAFPSGKRMLKKGAKGSESEAALIKTSENDKITRILGDISQAAIRCGVKNLIVNPFGYPLLAKNIPLVSEMWVTLIESKQFSEHIESIDFAVENENNFITLGSKILAKLKTVSSNI